MKRILIALVVVVGLGSNAWGMSLFDQSKKNWFFRVSRG